MGHSVGEYVAACVAGVLTLEDALTLVAARGRLMQALPPGGAMAAIMADERRVAAALPPHAGRIEIAAVNGPAETVVAGDGDAIAALTAALKGQGLDVRALTVSHAFHSRLIEPMLDEFETVAAGVGYSAPRMTLISNLTGAAIDRVDAAYWRAHARGAVRFAEGITAAVAAGARVFVEVGPHPTLTRLGQLSVPSGTTATWVHSLRRGQDDWRQMLAAVRDLYVAGQTIDFDAVDRPHVRRTLALPTYRFQRERFWFESPKRKARAGSKGDLSLLGRRLRSAAVKETIFETTLGVPAMRDLNDHRVQGQPLVPAAVFVELALEAAVRMGLGQVRLEDVSFQSPLTFGEGEERTVQTVVSPAGGRLEFRILSAPADESDADPGWTEHVAGSIRRQDGSAVPRATATLEQARSACREVAASEYYGQLAARGIDLGPAFRAISGLWIGEAGAAAELVVPAVGERAKYQIHPALFDACCHVAGAAVGSSAGAGETYLLAHLGGVEIFDVLESRVWCRASVRAQASGPARTVDIEVVSPDGRVLARLEGLQFRKVRDVSTALPADWLYEVSWQPLAPGRAAEASFGAADVAAGGGLAIAHLASEPDTQAYGAGLDQIERLSTAYIHDAFRALGWQPRPGDVFDASQLKGKLGIVPRQAALFRRLLQILAADGVLTLEADRLTVTRSFDGEPVEALRASVAASHSIMAAELELTTRCGASLSAVLKGEANPVELLFPGGSLELAERVYEKSGASRVFAQVVEHGVAAAVAQHPHERPLRVLEIGGGTGSMTGRVLPLLPAERSQYVFTDVSPVFTTRARHKFKAFSFVDYRLLDISRDPVSDGFVPHTFDIVLAANVLHATADLRETLRHANRLLAPGGLLMIVESVRASRWLDITFGMTEGWWQSRDLDRRGGHPLMTIDGWMGMLAEVGFEAPSSVPAGEMAASSWASQALLLAQTPRGISSAAVEPASAGTWLVLADGRGVGERFASRAAAAGDTCVTAVAGAGRDGSLATSPTSAADFDRLLDRALASGAPLKGVVHCWNLDAPDNSEVSAASLVRAESAGCSSVVLLLQAMLRRTASARVFVATRGAQSVEQNVPSIAQAPVWGLGRAAALEYPDMWGGLIDLAPDGTTEAAGDDLWSAIGATGDEDQVAIRNGARYGARLTRAQADVTEPVAVRADGTYLVTGGAGGLGLRVARWLAAQGARHLVLASRRALPDRASWPSLAPDSEAREAVDTIAALESAGTTVVQASLDIADEQAAAALFARFGDEYPPLRGVLHLASARGVAELKDMSLDALDAMLRPKVAGTWALHQLTRDLDLDFFVLYSSTTGLLGSKGLAHYAAANTFLDAFAQFRRARNLPALSINWGTWDVMYVGSDEGRRAIARGGLHPMASAKALGALGALLGERRAQIAVAAVDWDALRSVFEARRRRPFLERLGPKADTQDKQQKLQNDADPGSSLPGRLASVRPEDRREALIAYVRRESAQVLALDPDQIDEQQGLFDMGMDSLMSVELKTRLEKSVGRRLPTTLTFNYPSVTALAEFLEAELFPASQNAPAAPPAPSSAGPASAAAGGRDEDDMTEEELEALLAEKLSRR